MLLSGIRRAIVLSLCGVTLAGCGANHVIPDVSDKDLVFQGKDVTYHDEYNENWQDKIAPISYIYSDRKVIIEKPSEIPQSLLNSGIEIKLRKNSVLGDLIPFFAAKGIHLIIAEQEIYQKPLILTDFKGKFKDFLKSVSAAYGLSFNYHDGSIMTLDQMGEYVIKVPQNKEIITSIKGFIEGIGASDITSSLEAGIIAYKANPQKNNIIKNYLERLTVNTSLISMQVAIINVNISDTIKEGFDWDKLSMKLGRGAINSDSSGTSGETDTINSLTSDGDTSTSTESSDVTTTDNSLVSGAVSEALDTGVKFSDMTAEGSISGTGTNFKIGKGDFSLSAAINFLRTYGNTETRQSLMLKTLSNKEVAVDISQNIPYVDSVSASTDDGTDDDNTLSSADIKDVSVGLKLNIVPIYDHQSEIVTIDLDMKLSSFIGFIELKAGDLLGSVTRPKTQNQNFTDLIQMKAGESAIIGGITYDNISDNRNAPSFLSKAGVAGINKNIERQAMFIIIRPTVTIYGKKGS